MDHMNFTNTTTSWNIINLHNIPMTYHHHHDHLHHQDQDQDDHPLHCIPIWPLAFPLHMTQDQEPAPAEIKNRDRDQEMDACDDIGHCIPMRPLAFPLHHTTQEQDQERPVPVKIKNRDLDQEMDGCDDISHCIPMCPLAFPLLRTTQEQEQDQETVPAEIKDAKKSDHGQEPVPAKIKNRDHDQETDGGDETEEEEEELGAVKEMMYKMAAMRPVDVDPAAARRPRRRNVRISDDPQSMAARRRRERISERMRVLQGLVPGGAKMDTAAMLDEAARYVKFLKRQIRRLQSPDDRHLPLPPPPPAPASIRIPSWPQYR